MRKRVGLPDPYPLLKTKPKELDGAVAKEDVDDLPEDIFTKPVNLAECKIHLQWCRLLAL